MFEKLLKKIFGDKHEKTLKPIYPIINEINEKYATLASLSDDELRARITEIKSNFKSLLDPEFEGIDQLHKEYITEINDVKKDKLSNDLDVLKASVKQKVQDLLNDNLVEVFAIVKDTCRRLMGHKYLN